MIEYFVIAAMALCIAVLSWRVFQLRKPVIVYAQPVNCTREEIEDAVVRSVSNSLRRTGPGADMTYVPEPGTNLRIRTNLKNEA